MENRNCFSPVINYDSLTFIFHFLPYYMICHSVIVSIPYSIIHPQVVILHFFSDLGNEIYVFLMENNNNFSSSLFPIQKTPTLKIISTSIVYIMLSFIYIIQSVMCIYIALEVVKMVF